MTSSENKATPEYGGHRPGASRSQALRKPASSSSPDDTDEQTKATGKLHEKRRKPGRLLGEDDRASAVHEDTTLNVPTYRLGENSTLNILTKSHHIGG